MKRLPIMFPSTLRVFIAVVAVAVLAGSADARSGPVVGGWTPIKNVSDPHVKEIAKFAVSEYNKQSNSTLQLLKVLSGETQVVAGMNYRLVLTAKDGAGAKAKEPGKYQAVVLEKAWENSKNLTSFKPLKA